MKTRDEIAKAYEAPPWLYDIRGFFILTFAYNSTLTNQLRFFGRNFGSEHLEVACGTGTLLELVLRWRQWKKLPKVHITGVDYAESMLNGAIERFRNMANVRLLHADAANMPLPSGHFDTVNIANSIHCLPDVDGSLREMHRVLKFGGHFAANVLIFPDRTKMLGRIAHTINEWGKKKGILYTPYHQNEIIDKMVCAGFKITSQSTSGNCLNVVATKLDHEQKA